MMCFLLSPSFLFSHFPAFEKSWLQVQPNAGDKVGPGKPCQATVSTSHWSIAVCKILLTLACQS